MPEMSGKLKSNPTKTNKLIFIMMGGIYFSRGVGGGNYKFHPPPFKILVYAPATVHEFRSPYPNYFRM